MGKVILKLFPILCMALVKTTLTKHKSFPERYKILRAYCIKALARLGYSIDIEQPNTNKETCLIASNHQGFLDILVLVASNPYPFTFVSKASNAKSWLFRHFISYLDVILFEREDRTSTVKMLRDVMHYLDEGKSVLIFPEGTRSKSQKVGEFKSGSLYPAFKQKSMVQPVTLNHTHTIESHSKHKTLGVYYHHPILCDSYKSIDEFSEMLRDLILTKIWIN